MDDLHGLEWRESYILLHERSLFMSLPTRKCVNILRCTDTSRYKTRNQFARVDPDEYHFSFEGILDGGLLMF